MREGGYSDPKGVWGELSSGSCESFAQSAEAEPAEAPAPSEPARRGEAIERWKEKRWPSLKKGP
jgi:hypothetical protein